VVRERRRRKGEDAGRDAVQVQERGAWAASASGRVDFILRAMAGSEGNRARKRNSEHDFIF
jgi:hypothetical protein